MFDHHDRVVGGLDVGHTIRGEFGRDADYYNLFRFSRVRLSSLFDADRDLLALGKHQEVSATFLLWFFVRMESAEKPREDECGIDLSSHPRELKLAHRGCSLFGYCRNFGVFCLQYRKV